MTRFYLPLLMLLASAAQAQLSTPLPSLPPVSLPGTGGSTQPPVLNIPAAPATPAPLPVPSAPALPPAAPPVAVPGLPIVGNVPTVPPPAAPLAPLPGPLSDLLPIPAGTGALPAALQDLLQGLGDPTRTLLPGGSGGFGGSLPCPADGLCQLELPLAAAPGSNSTRRVSACEFVGSPQLNFGLGNVPPDQAAGEYSARVVVQVRCLAGVRYRLRASQGVVAAPASRLAARVGTRPAWVQLSIRGQPIEELQFVGNGEVTSHQVEARLLDTGGSGRTPRSAGSITLPPDVLLGLDW